MISMIKKLKSNLYITLLVCFAIIMSMTVNQICNMPCCQELIETACCDNSSNSPSNNTFSNTYIIANNSHCIANNDLSFNDVENCNDTIIKALDFSIALKNHTDLTLYQNKNQTHIHHFFNKSSINKPIYSSNFSFTLKRNTPLIC